MNFLYKLIIPILILFSCTPNSEKNILESETEFDKEPDNWLYEQRAYPFKTINHELFNREFQKVQVARKEKKIQSRTLQNWKLLGPTNIGGRVTDIALNPQDTSIFFVSTAVGGIFKTTDRGQSWKPVFDEAGRLSVGSIAIAPSNSKIMYAGTGEANASAASGAFFGDGVYKSIDGGRSWENVGLPKSYHIGRVVVNPYNPDHVLVAAGGQLYDKNPERGLYQSKDGGANWEKLLFVSDSTACIDVALHPIDTNIIYTVTWERHRLPWKRSYAGETSRLYRSKDGGQNWEELNNGLPPNNGDRGRMGIAISQSDPNVLYLSTTSDEITNKFEGLYKSVDGGDTWRRTQDFFLTGMYGGFGWYFGNVRIDPNDPDIAYTLGVSLYQTQSGGSAWKRIGAGVHVDHHALEIHPKNSDFMVLGNDGGVYISVDKGQTWTHAQGLPITQFYECEVSQSSDNHYYGGTQDNGTIMTSDGKMNAWSEILGGDGFHVIVDPQTPEILYAEYQWGNLFRSVNGGQSFQWALRGVESSDRNNWNTPIAIDPSNTSTLYYGTNRLYRSNDRAANWRLISEDLTKGNQFGTNSYGTITTIAVSPANSDIVYVGTDDGNVQVTFDNGNTWQLISDGLPNRYITSIACDWKNPLTAFVTLSGYRKTDYLPHVFMTKDGGRSWEDLSANLPEVPINDIILDRENPNTIFVATDLGVWTQKQRDQDWTPLGDGLPNTIITDLVLHERNRTLIAATFGRSLYEYKLNFIVPDLPRVDTVNINFSIAPNPARDIATIAIEVQERQEAQVVCRDMQGKVIQRKESVWLEKGMNRIAVETTSFPISGEYVVSVETKRGILSKVLKVVR